MRTAGWGRLGRVPLRFPLEILRAVAEKAAGVRNQHGAYLPGVRLDLAARSSSYYGNVLAIEERGDGTLVLFRDSNGPLTYIHLGVHEPFSIAIDDPEDQLALLGGDAAPRWSSDGPLSSLQAKRAVAEVAARFEASGAKLDVTGIEWKESSVENNAVRDVAQAIDAWRSKASGDPLVAEALRALKSIELRTVADAQVTKAGDVLTVGISKAGFESAEALVEKIEKAL